MSSLALIRPDAAWRSPGTLAALALTLAVVNLTFRLDREMVDVWDESLYATSALEMLETRQWAVTTFQGAVDYFNSKPPLNVWLIAGSFSLFGINLVALRLPSVLAAWVTVLAMHVWTRHHLGPARAALTTLVLGTSYGFVYVHSGRTANTDALLTLAVTLTFITLSRARTRPWLTVASGPLAAAVFLLKGPAALALVAPLVIAHAVDLARAGAPLPGRLRPWAAAAVLFAVPVGAWSYARWRFDGWRLFARMIGHDALGRGFSAVEGHGESPLYYFDIVQRHHYEWLVAVAAALVLTRGRRGEWRRELDAVDVPWRLVIAWFGAAFVLPTLMPTKLAWYINPVYPLLAVAAAVVLHGAWRRLISAGATTRARVLVAVIVVAVLTAEGKMAWRSYVKLDLGRSAQELFLTQAATLPGRRVFAAVCPYPEAFLARVAASQCVTAPDVQNFLSVGGPDDLWLDAPGLGLPGLTSLAANHRAALYARRR